MPSLSPAEAKAAERHRWRSLRRSQSAEQRATASRLICSRIVDQPVFQRVTHIAAYLALSDEVNLSGLLDRCQALGKQIWLPRVTDQHMAFAAYDPRERGALVKSRVGTYQPKPEAPVRSTQRLDLVLLPVLAFTRRGDRLGMGGGYYDRTFSFMLPTRPGSGPELVGVAFTVQEAERLPSDPWDVPLHHVATQQEWIDCK
ncbi:MAG: 5-formyltetrahydrofolate cyclo-ligase [Pseudomonadota bacterium]